MKDAIATIAGAVLLAVNFLFLLALSAILWLSPFVGLYVIVKWLIN